MSEIKIVIPSAGRFQKPASTTRIIDKAILCVPETQALYYKRANPGIEIVDHPEEIVGMGNKRNWICETFGDVFMMDDDLKGVQKNCRPYYERNLMLPPEEAYEQVQWLGSMCRATGAVLFGWGNATNFTMFKPQEPFRLSGYINAASMGVLKNDLLRFNPDIVSANDYYISGLNAYHYRHCLKDMRFVVVQGGVRNSKGGMAGKQTDDTIRKDSLLLRKFFGEAVQAKKVNNKNYKTRNRYGRVLMIPY